jgi:hypothetical protein
MNKLMHVKTVVGGQNAKFDSGLACRNVAKNNIMILQITYAGSRSQNFFITSQSIL